MTDIDPQWKGESDDAACGSAWAVCSGRSRHCANKVGAGPVGGMARQMALVSGISLDLDLDQLTDSMSLTCIPLSHEIRHAAIGDQVITRTRGRMVCQGCVDAIGQSSDPLLRPNLNALSLAPVAFQDRWSLFEAQYGPPARP